MTETSFTPETGDADIAAYEHLNLLQLDQESEISPEKKLEKVLVHVLFYSKILLWIGIGMLLLTGLYGWTRNQAQDGWLANLSFNTSGSAMCTWMNHGYDENLLSNKTFRAFLTEKGKENFLQLMDSGHCLALDTIADWLTLQQQFESRELATAYASILPKKFLASTIVSSPELKIIEENLPTHRMHHDIILKILTDATLKVNDNSSEVACSEVRFFALTAEAHCQIASRAPVQPRSKALEFLSELSATQSVLITYPSTLDMTIDAKTNRLVTDFTVSMTYIPARYEADTLQQLTYEKP